MDKVKVKQEVFGKNGDIESCEEFKAEGEEEAIGEKEE